MVANFICAVTVSLIFSNQDPEIWSMVQLATIAVISMLSCIVLIQLNSSRVAAEEAMDTLVAKDKLTGLTNREAFQRYLANRVANDKNQAFILLLLDLDRFKELNAFLGYGAADQILQQFATRLAQLAETEADAARIGRRRIRAGCPL